MPRLANAAIDWRWLRRMLSARLGISGKRPLPHYAAERFDRWFARHANGADGNAAPAPQRRRRGRVLLWDDTFARYHEPHIGIAAVAVLEAAGFEVLLARGRRCCGRPAFSVGNLDEATRLGRHNLQLLNGPNAGAPIVFLEPSCYSMFVEDYRELNLREAEHVAGRCFLFEQFMAELLDREPDALAFKQQQAVVALHAHCHAKSLLNPAFMTRLVERLPGRKATLLETGCCGMAGAFGALEAKYELSLKVARTLVEKLEMQPSGSITVASGASCRHQIEHLTPVCPRHMAQLLAEALA